MNYLDILINRVEIMFIIIILGFVLRKTNFIDDSITKTMGDIMLKIITPLTIFNSFITECTKEKTQLLLICLIISILIHIIAIIIATLIFRNNHPVEKFAIVMGNVGFFGIAIAVSVVGQQAAFYSASFVAVNALTLWTYGSYAMSNNDLSVIKPGLIIKNLNVVATILGLIFYFVGINIPNVFKDTISSLSNINSPVCGLIIGVGLAHTKFNNFKGNLSLVISIVCRLIVIPIITIYILSFIPNTYFELKITLLIVSSVPTASATNIFANAYKQDISIAARIVSFSTLLCVVTMPLITKLAYIIWGI